MKAPDPASPPEGVDPRDIIYAPPTLDVPPAVLPDPALIEILDQGDTSASVGFALAAVLHYLRAERGIRERLNPFFLYDNARRFDEWAAEPHEGSSLRGGLKGLSRHGAALDLDASLPRSPAQKGNAEGRWLARSPDELPPDVVGRALANRPASYERVERSIEHLKAAVHDLHAVLVAAAFHDGWSTTPKGEIQPRPAAKARGGSSYGSHAFAVIGYTDRGFIVQNSWGQQWGGAAVDGTTLPGCAIWPFADAAQTLEDAWIVRLSDAAGVAAKVLAGYASDSIGGPDLLEVRRDAQAFSLVLASREVDPPLAIGLFGDWGGGKSFFMELMQEEIDGAVKRAAGAPETSPFFTNVVSIRFNAWHYLDSDLWASLVTEVFDRLFERIAPKADLAEGLREQLADAQGLFQHAKRQLDEARTARTHADTALKDAIARREAQERTLATQLDDIRTLLSQDPEVQGKLNALATALGADELGTSFSALERKAQELKSLGGRTSVLLQSTLGSPGGYLRVLALGGVLLLPVAIAFGIEWLQSAHQAEISDVRSLAMQVSTLVAGLTAWLGVLLKRGNAFIGTLEQTHRRLEALRAARLAQGTAREVRELQAAREREDAARTAMREAELRVQTIERELAEQAPGRLIYRFIEERAKSTEYRSRLGIISLVRRDFERLSHLFEQGKKNSAIKQIMPVERIILYIDDLDRCKPDRVIEVLEAVHLLLAFPLFMVVVAVDPRWLRRCLEKHYPDLLALRSEQARVLGDVLPSRPATAQDYLEKIFQVPFTLQPLRGEGFRKLVRGLAAPKVASATTTPAAPAPGSPAPAGAGAPLVVAGTGAAPGAAAVTGGGTPPPPAPPAPPTEAESIERLTISAWELDDIQNLSALFRTPRTVKRFINTYRFLRASLPPAERALFIGNKEAPGDYRVVIVLLAIVVSFPNIAPLFLQRLLDYGDGGGHRTWRAFLGSVQLKRARPLRAARDVGAKPRTEAASAKAAFAGSTQPSWEEAEWRQLCDALDTLREARNANGGEFPPNELDLYARWTPRVARYSFSLSALLTLQR